MGKSSVPMLLLLPLPPNFELTPFLGRPAFAAQRAALKAVLLALQLQGPLRPRAYALAGQLPACLALPGLGVQTPLSRLRLDRRAKAQRGIPLQHKLAHLAIPRLRAECHARRIKRALHAIVMGKERTTRREGYLPRLRRRDGRAAYRLWRIRLTRVAFLSLPNIAGHTQRASHYRPAFAFLSYAARAPTRILHHKIAIATTLSLCLSRASGARHIRLGQVLPALGYRRITQCPWK